MADCLVEAVSGHIDRLNRHKQGTWDLIRNDFLDEIANLKGMQPATVQKLREGVTPGALKQRWSKMKQSFAEAEDDEDSTGKSGVQPGYYFRMKKILSDRQTTADAAFSIDDLSASAYNVDSMLDALAEKGKAKAKKRKATIKERKSRGKEKIKKGKNRATALVRAARRGTGVLKEGLKETPPKGPRVDDDMALSSSSGNPIYLDFDIHTDQRPKKKQKGFPTHKKKYEEAEEARASLQAQITSSLSTVNTVMTTITQAVQSSNDQNGMGDIKAILGSMAKQQEQQVATAAVLAQAVAALTQAIAKPPNTE